MFGDTLKNKIVPITTFLSSDVQYRFYYRIVNIKGYTYKPRM